MTGRSTLQQARQKQNKKTIQGNYLIIHHRLVHATTALDFYAALKRKKGTP